MNDVIIDAPFRKQMRLQGHNYAQAGYYFITICTENRRKILGNVVGGDAHIAPSVLLNEIGVIAEKYIKNIDLKYKNVYIDKYVIMPNHIHMIIVLNDGAMWASPPTINILSKIIRSLKTLVTKEAHTSIFQESYYDHIIRDEADYLTKWNYIVTNPAKWADDEYFNS